MMGGVVQVQSPVKVGLGVVLQGGWETGVAGLRPGVWGRALWVLGREWGQGPTSKAETDPGKLGAQQGEGQCEG